MSVLDLLAATMEGMLLDDEDLQQSLERAKRFFKTDYMDRGMVKWQGYFLSDHTEDVSKYSEKRRDAAERADLQEMSPVAISECLLEAYAQHQPVTIQLRNHTVAGHSSPFYHGMVSGIQGDQLVLLTEKVQRRFLFEDILWVGDLI